MVRLMTARQAFMLNVLAVVVIAAGLYALVYLAACFVVWKWLPAFGPLGRFVLMWLMLWWTCIMWKDPCFKDGDKW